MIFRTTLLSTGKTAAGIVVPPEIVDAPAASRRPRVRVTINNHTYPQHDRREGRPVSARRRAKNRHAARIQPETEIDIELSLDSEPRQVTVPSELAAALGRRTRRPVRDSTPCPTAPSNASRCRSKTLGHPRPGNAACRSSAAHPAQSRRLTMHRVS